MCEAAFKATPDKKDLRWRIEHAQHLSAADIPRKTTDGSVFYGDQKMSRAEALKGSPAPGKLADITVLSKDIMTVPEDEIPSTVVTYTIVGGRVAYKKSQCRACRPCFICGPSVA